MTTMWSHVHLVGDDWRFIFKAINEELEAVGLNIPDFEEEAIKLVNEWMPKGW